MHAKSHFAGQTSWQNQKKHKYNTSFPAASKTRSLGAQKTIFQAKSRRGVVVGGAGWLIWQILVCFQARGGPGKDQGGPGAKRRLPPEPPTSMPPIPKTSLMAL